MLIQTNNGSLICLDDTHLVILDNKTGEFWRSDRISWDGFKELSVHENVLRGKTYKPLDSEQPWGDFSLDLKTKTLTGGSFQDFLRQNPHLQANQDGRVSKKIKQPWWKKLWPSNWRHK